MGVLKQFCLWMVFLWLPLAAFANPADINFGLVKEGSFLLSKQPNIMRDGVMVHRLIGYLPTGTRVIIEEKHQVTNLETTDDEIYYFVRSELGVKGLLREDLLIQAKGRRLAVSIASYPIQIHQPSATLKNPRKRFTLGRYGGNYLEITGESEPGFYDVVLHRVKGVTANLPAKEHARLRKFYVERKQVSLLDPHDQSLSNEFQLTWSTVPNTNDYFGKVIEKIKEKIDNDFDQVKAIVSEVNDLQCLLEGSINGELGFKVFSNGFALELDAQLKKKGVKYSFETKKLTRNNAVKFFSGIGAIKCDGGKPIRLQSFTVQEGLYSIKKRFSITLADLEKADSPWITTLQNSKISNKMVRIAGWNEYNQLMKKLNNFAMSGDGYLASLPEKTRILLLNYIISRISYFEHRQMIIDRAILSR